MPDQHTAEGGVDRRDLIKGGALAGAALSIPLQGMLAREAEAAPVNATGQQTDFEPSPYGPIAPVADLTTGLPLIQLPRGFSYRSLGWTGDIMADGQATPGLHDGMAVVRSGTGRAGRDVLIRNHEIRGGAYKFFVKDGAANVATAEYDNAPAANGGTTVLTVQGGKIVDDRANLAGSIVNCAGGPSLWGTWLTCEETVAGVDNTPGLNQTHGWVFETAVDPKQTVAQPIVDMGRFSHEAVAFDPRNGDVYLTEDARNIALFYRFRPADTSRAYGALIKGGVLEAAKVVGKDKANFLALEGPLASDVKFVGQSFAIEWVRVLNPGAAPARYTEAEPGNPAPIVPPANPLAANVAGTFAQGRDAGALRLCRGEGIWYNRVEDAFYYTDTNFGYNGAGQAGRGPGAVWKYRPDRSNPNRGTLTLVHHAANFTVGNNPDNITVSPKGGVVFMEDGAGVEDQFGIGNRLMGLTKKGDAYIFAKNNINLTAAQVTAAGKDPAFHVGDNRGNEWAGGTFSPDGRVLYVNIQTPGITFAIAGPWGRGNL